MASITSILGAGSGVDTSALVTQLVSAQRDTKVATLDARSEKVAAQISGISLLKSGLLNFSTALNQLISGGSLSTQPTSSNTDILTASAIAGQSLGQLSASVEVRQLATAQTLTAAAVDPAVPLGKGTLTITLGAATHTDGDLTGFAPRLGATPIEITIDDSNNSLAGIAAAINKANAGVTATIVNDGTGGRLVLKGATGAASAFTIDVAEDADAPGLSRFAYAPGNTSLALGQQAGDAVLSVDGVVVNRATNSIDDLIPGIRLDLKSAAVGQPVDLGSARPTAALSQAVQDVVAAYNELLSILQEETAPETGVLRGDSGIRQMQRMLQGLTSTPLVATGSPRTLAEIGVRTNRDGTLSVDTAKLNTALTANPAQIEAMFNPSQSSDNPLVRITSTNGTTPAGTYQATDLVAATVGRLTGGSAAGAFATPLVLDATNNSFSVTLNGGAVVQVLMPQGSYEDGASFSAVLAAAINTAVGKAAIAWDGDHLVASSATLGATSQISIVADDAALNTLLGLDAATATDGTNASGKINGVPALAAGNLLFAASGSGATGMIIELSGNAGSALLSVDLGIGAALTRLSNELSSTSGSLYATTERLTKQQASIAEEKQKVEDKAAALKTRLTAQFAAMDARVAAYKQTQSFLEQQIDAWNGANR